MSLTLIQLSELEQELLDKLSSEDQQQLGLSEKEQAEIIDQYLTAEEGFKAKVDSYLTLITGLKGVAEFRKAEADRLEASAKSNFRLAKLLNDRLLYVLQQRGETRVDTPHFKVSVAGSGGLKPLRVPQEWEANPSSAPEDFHRRRIELDKTAIRERLENGEVIEGCILEERSKRLIIK